MNKTDLIRALSGLKEVGDLDTIHAKISDLIAALEKSDVVSTPLIPSGIGGGADGSATKLSLDTEAAIISCVETGDVEQLESILARYPSADLSTIYVDRETAVSVVHRAVELGNEKISRKNLSSYFQAFRLRYKPSSIPERTEW